MATSTPATAPKNDDETPTEWDEYANGSRLYQLFSEQLTERRVRKSVLVLRKTLTPSDVRTNQSRLQLAMSDVNNSVLGFEVPEVRALADYWENTMSVPKKKKARTEASSSTGENGNNESPAVNLKAKVLNYRGQEFDMSFRYLSTSKTYRLLGGWNEFAKENAVQAGEILDLLWFDVRELGDAGADYDVGFGILNFERTSREDMECAEALLLLTQSSDSASH